jgi:hypothetical protein
VDDDDRMSHEEVLEALRGLLAGLARPYRWIRPDRPLTGAERTARWHAHRREFTTFQIRRGSVPAVRCAECGEALAVDARTDARYCSAACRQRAYRRRQRAGA